MKKNIGNTDKIIKIILGLAIGAIGFYYKSWWGLIGIIPALTVIVSWCPLYFPFGIITCRKS